MPRKSAFRFVEALAVLKQQAFEVGLYETGHALDKATKVAGFELAEQLKKAMGKKNVKRNCGN